VIISLVLKATAILIVGLAASRLAHRSRAAVRHAILVATFAALAILPIATLTLPALTIDVPISQSGAPNTTAPAETGAPMRAIDIAGAPEGPGTAPEGPGFHLRETLRWTTVALAKAVSPGTTIIVLWLAGAGVFLVALLYRIWRVQQLRRTALPAIELPPILADLTRAAGLSRPVDLLIHERLAAPVACGLVRAAVIMPPDAPQWSQAALQRALIHELEHIKRRDWLTQLAAHFVCAAYWFHPLVWIAQRRLCLHAEHACDDAVLASGDGATYADQLVALARRMAARPPIAALGMAHRSDLSARVNAVLDASRPRGRAGIARAIVIATAATALLAALAPLTIAAAGPNVQGASRQERTGRASWRDRALVEAADAGRLQEVRELLDEGANVNAMVDGDGSPLIAAAREGHLELVTLLLDRGADVNLAVTGDGAPLIMAAREGHLAIVLLLLDRGADVDQIVPGDENALMQASGEGHLEVVKLLVARGASVNARVQVQRRYEAVGVDERGRRRVSFSTQEEWRTALNMAQQRGHRAVVEFLRSAGAVE
jgi:bla regulator protein blaR1